MATPTLTGLKVRLCPKSIADARRDYRWQKDAELMALNGNEPLRESFLEYLTQGVAAYDGTAEIETFAICTLPENRHIGNCALYYIDRTVGQAQLGITIGERDCWGQGYGCDAVAVLSNYAFRELGLLKLGLRTLENNDRAKRCFVKCGFAPCGALVLDGRSYILMELTASRRRPGE